MLKNTRLKATGSALLASAMALGAWTCTLPANADDGEWRELQTTAARADNPLKGFMPFGMELDHEAADFPYTMEWFYLPLDAVVKGENTYDWAEFESNLSAIAERGHQAALRFYVDYPGQDSGIPDYLLGPDGIDQSRRYDLFDNEGKSFSPDYNDPRIQALLNDFVTEFGLEYDGDPRIGYITTGLIGFWGEQHTWPMNGYADAAAGNPEGEQWMPEREVELDHYRAWDAAFDTTPILNRYPYDGLEGIDVGFHDDSFAVSTLPGVGWHFMDHMIANEETERWQTAPIGGEIQPPVQMCVFAPEGCTDVIAEDFDEAVELTHVSWLMNHRAYSVGYEGQTLEAALAAHASLGYDFAVTKTRVDEQLDGTHVAVTIENRGVAPFYYDWPMEFVLLDDSGAVVDSVKVDGRFDEMLPGAALDFEAELATGEGVVALRVPNSMEGGAPLKFANADQDADFDGFLTLGKVAADPEPSPQPTPEPTPTNGPKDPVKPGLPSTGV